MPSKRYCYVKQSDENFKKIIALLELGGAIGWFSSNRTELNYNDFMYDNDIEDN